MSELLNATDVIKHPQLSRLAAEGRLPDNAAEILRDYVPPTLNTSGFAPLDLRVLVLPDPVNEKAGSIFLPDSVKEQQRWAQARGTLVAVGDNAWQEAKARAPHFQPPEPGDRVLYGKYSGQTIEGADGQKYQIMNDEDVIARIIEKSED